MNFKLFGKNAIIYAFGNISLRAASFLLIPIYTHTLSVKDYGLLVTLLVTIQIMIVFIGIGTRTGFIRFAAEYERKNQTGRLLGSTILINMAGGAVVIIISVLFLLPFFRVVLRTNYVIEYVILSCFAALCHSLCIHIVSYYRARNESMKFMFASGAGALLLIFTNLIFLLVLNLGVKGVLIAQIITYGSLWLFVAAKVIINTGIEVSRDLILKLIRFGFPLVFANSGDYITDASAIYILSYFRDLEQVAIYFLGFKIAQISSIVLILPFQLAYEPFVYANINVPGIRVTLSKLLTYLMVCFSFVAIGIAFISRDLLPVIAPPEYLSAYLVIFLVLPATAFRGVSYIGESLLHIKNKTQVTGTVVTVFTLLSLVLNYMLIPRFGMYGAIFVYSLTLISIAVILMKQGIKVFPINLEIRRLVISGILLISLLFLIFILTNTNIYIYHIIVPIVVLVSIACLYFWSFLDDKEMIVIKDILYRLRGALSQ